MTDTNEPITLWHASRSDVERPSVAGRIPGEHHNNSGLGLFCATGPHSYITGFGDHVHEITLKPGTRIMDMTVGELHKMSDAFGGRDRAWFEGEGNRLTKEYDIIMIKEKNGYASQAIILHDDCVDTTKAHSKEAFLENAISIMDAMEAHDAERPQRIYGRGLDRSEETIIYSERSSHQR